MEFVRKVRVFIIISLILVFSGCASKSISVAADPLVLLEITPLPKSVQIKKQVLYEPIYGVMRVLEITLENGVQTELMAKKGDITTGLEKGVVGEIAEDAAFGEIIGTFKIVSVVNGFVTCKIENVTKKIPSNAYIRVVVGQRIKEE